MDSDIKNLRQQIKELAQHAETAVEAAKASAAIAYTASVDNVKANKNFEAKLDAYIVADMAWKKRAEPAIELGNVAREASKTVLWLGGFIIVIGGAVRIIIDWIKHR